VLPFREDHRWPADIYLEGSDQHRGWFHSSLLVGIGTRGRAPFNQVLTHGFVMAEDGRKMSKSLGNSVAPQDVIKQSGAEVLRLWASMVDYREDIRIGKEILTRTIEAYRKIRNVLRVLVANLYDFDPADDAVPVGQLEEIDRWMLAKYAEVATKIVQAYDDYDYPTVFQLAVQFITVDVSAVDVDGTKDRMYTLGAKSGARRSGQTAMFTVVDGLARLLAPILSVTMDELWRGLPGPREASVHMALFPRQLEGHLDADLVARWTRLGAVRDAVNVALEQKRQDKTISGNLSAAVEVRAGGDALELLRRYEAWLPTLFGVSAVQLLEGGGPDDAPGIAVSRADGTKCERCWRVVPAVSSASGREGLCPRCVEALAEAVSL
jgi:isoleucyl-tRNA synthetase